MIAVRERFQSRRSETALADRVLVERGLRRFRFAFGVIIVAALIGLRGGSVNGTSAFVVALEVVLGIAFINAFTWFCERRHWYGTAAIGGQVLDVAGTLLLAGMLNKPLGDAGWILLLLPIVVGGVRMGAAGTLLAWAMCLGGYLGLITSGLIISWSDKTHTKVDVGNEVRHFALLLALAVPVAALTQWLQQRWEHQRQMTAAADARAQRLALVEANARDLTGLGESDLVSRLAHAGVALGFDAVTVTRHDEEGRWAVVAALGDTDLVPGDGVPALPVEDETVVTEWHNNSRPDEHLVTSVSIALERGPNGVGIHGWSAEPVDDDQAGALGLLGAHARVALTGTRLLAELSRRATQDPLTGLLNRGAFDDHLRELSQIESPATLLFLDLDRFKQVNDELGHQAGDDLLIVVGRRLAASAPGIGAVARLGGDEFAVVLPFTDADAVVEVAERIEASMAEPVALGPAVVPLSFSIGIADAPPGWTPEFLLAAADGAVYQAKANGRNRSCWADPLQVG